MTIKDIAALAGVSPSTVSKILNNKDDSISGATRNKVLHIIREYNYVPYAMAQKKYQSINNYLIAFLVDLYHFPKPILITIQNKLQRAGYDLMLCDHKNDPEEEKKHLSRLAVKGIDGVFCNPAKADSEFWELMKVLDKPGVIQTTAVKNIPGILSYHIDDEKLMKSAVSHCAEMGHKSICAALDASVDNGRYEQFIKGYKQGMLDHGLDFYEGLLIKGDDFEPLMQSGGQVVICENEDLAAKLYAFAARVKLKIPGDLSVLCLNNGEKAYFNPALSYVTADYEKLGVMMCRDLLGMIEGRSKSLPIHRRVDAFEIIPGESLRKAEKKRKIIVVGSMNTDIMVHVPAIPIEGRTTITNRVLNEPGGKGANQAVGVGKLGGSAYLIGCIGNDQGGRNLMWNMKKYNVNVDGVTLDKNAGTGQAYIFVAANGESTISVYQGANLSLKPAYIESLRHMFDDAVFCLISTEISIELVQSVVDIAYEKGVKIIMKPCALKEIDSEILRKLYIFVPNLNEIQALLPEGSLEEKTDKLLARGVANVIVTLGEQGCYFKNNETAKYFPAADFPAVDTTGGADAFISALAVSLSENTPMAESIYFANHAAGISVSNEGVQSALATREQLTGVNLTGRLEQLL